MIPAERRTLCVRIEARDGTIERVAAQYPHDLLMTNGSVYVGGLSTSTSSLQSQAEGGGAVLDFGFVEDSNHIDRGQIQSGKWDGAQVYAFATDWAHPKEDDEPLKRYTVGKIQDRDGRYQAQFMGLRDKLNEQNGDTYTRECSYIFCDNHLDTGVVPERVSRCKLNPATYTVTGTITSIDDMLTIYDSARTEADDWFGNGEIIFTTGANAGQPRGIIRSYEQAGGKLVLASPFYYPPQVGDQYTMIAGCRKRGDEDCTAKFSNRAQFGGFSYVPLRGEVARFETR